MIGKVVDIPVSSRRDEAWIRGEDPGTAGTPLKRLTIEVEEPRHRRLEVESAREGLTMSAFVRRLLDGELGIGAHGKAWHGASRHDAVA